MRLRPQWIQLLLSEYYHSQVGLSLNEPLPQQSTAKQEGSPTKENDYFHKDLEEHKLTSKHGTGSRYGHVFP